MKFMLPSSAVRKSFISGRRRAVLLAAVVSLAAASGVEVQGATDIWQGPGGTTTAPVTGAWSLGSNWSLGSIPLTTAADITFGGSTGGYTVTNDVGTLTLTGAPGITLNSTDALNTDFIAGSEIDFSTTTGASILTQNGTGAFTFTNSTVKFLAGMGIGGTGSGKITFGTDNTTSFVFGGGAASTFGGVAAGTSGAATMTAPIIINSNVAFTAAQPLVLDNGSFTINGSLSGAIALSVSTGLRNNNQASGVAFTTLPNWGANYQSLVLAGNDSGYSGTITVSTTANNASTFVLSARSPNALGTGIVNLTTTVGNWNIFEVGATLNFGAPGGNNTTGYDFVAALGNTAGTLNLTCANASPNTTGLAAYVAPGTIISGVPQTWRTVNIGNNMNAIITNGRGPWQGTGTALSFGSPTSNATLVIVNPLDPNRASSGPTNFPRSFRTLRGVGTVPEAMWLGTVLNDANANFAGSEALSGTGGVILANVNGFTLGGTLYKNTLAAGGGGLPATVSGSAGTLIDFSSTFYSGGLFVASDDAATAGVASPLGNTATTFNVGNNAASVSGGGWWTPLSNVNTGLMTYGQGTTGANPSPSITIARNLVIGSGGTGVMSLGGFTADHTKFSGTVNLNGVASVSLASASGGLVDFTGVISNSTGTSALQIGHAYIEGTSAATALLVDGGTVNLASPTGNTYNGGTTVMAGNGLAVNNTSGSATGVGNVTVAAGATLGGSGIIAPTSGNTVTIGSGVHLNPHLASGATTGTLTITTTPTLTIPNSILDFSFGSLAHDYVQVNGALTLTGVATLNITGLPGFAPSNTPGGSNYKLFSATGGLTLPDMVTISNDIHIGTNTGNPVFTYSFNVTGNDLNLNVQLPAGNDRTWAGTGANWDHSSFNWNGGTKFADYDRATFDNSGSAQQTVTTTEAVLPSAWTVNSDHGTADYTINSTAGAITGFTTLEKLGTSVLTLVGANTFSGAVNIHAGTVSVASLGSLGDASASNFITLGDTSTSGTLQYTGGGTVSTARNVTVNAGGGTLDLGAANATLSGVVAGSGDVSILQGSSNTLTLSNSANALTGSISVQQGTLSAVSLGTAVAGKTLTLGTGGNSANFTYTGPNFSGTRNVVLGPTSVITVTNAATTLTLGGTVSGSNLNIVGPGKVNIPTSVNLSGSSHSLTGNASLVLGAVSNTIAGTFTLPSGATLTAGAGSGTATSGALGSATMALTGGTLNLKAIGGAGGISGFGNAQLNGGAAVDGTFTKLTLIDGTAGNKGTSSFDYNSQSINAFAANFTYQATGVADGVTFCIQNDPRGVFAVGDIGGSLGYAGSTAVRVTPSAAVALDIFHVSQTAFGTNGVMTLPGANNTGSVVLGSNHPISVGLVYDGTTLTETLTDTVTSATYTTSYVTNLPGIIGQNSAYVGFTGGSAATSIQTVSNFSFGSPLVSYGNAVTLTASSTINSPAAVSGLGALTMSSGTTLTTSGLGVTFTSTAFSGAGTYNFAPAAGGFVALGTATDGGVALTINNSGAGNLVLASSNFTGVGTVVTTSGTGNVAIVGNSSTSNPLGTAVVQVGAGGGILVSADPSSSNVTIASTVTFAGSGSVTAAGLLYGTNTNATVNFGDATHGIGIASGKVITLGSSGTYTLNMSGPITGADATSGIAVSSGNVTLSVANPSFTGVAAVNGGTLTLATANALSNASSIPVASGATLAVNASAINLGAANILAGGTLKLSQNQAGGTPPTLPILGTLLLDSDSASGYNLALGNGSSIATTGYHTFYGNLTIAGTSTLTSSSSMQINGNISDGATAGSLAINMTGSTLFLYGNTSLGGTVTAAKGQVTLYGSMTTTGGTTIGSASPATFYDNGSLSGPVTVVTNGILNAISAANSLAGAAVTTTGGQVNIGVDNVLGTTGSVTATGTGYVNFTAAQNTHSPSLVIGTAANPGGAVFGDVTNFVWAYNPTGSATVVPGKVELYDGATIGITNGTPPTRASLGLTAAVFYQGVTNLSGTYSAGDDGVTIYKGLSFGAWTPGAATANVIFSGSITDTSTTGPGGTNVGMDVQMNGISVTLSGATLNTTDTAHGGFRFVGGGAVLTVNPFTGPSSMISRIGAASDLVSGAAFNGTPAAPIAVLSSGAITSGQTFAISSGRVILAATDAVAGTLIVNSGGVLDLVTPGMGAPGGGVGVGGATPSSGTVIVNAGGVVNVDPTTPLTGATYTFNGGAIVFDGFYSTGAVNTTSTQFGNADLIGSDNVKWTGAGITLANGHRFTTSTNNNATIMTAGGGGLNAAAGATGVILSAAVGTTLTINDNVNLAGVNLQLGDSAAYSTVFDWYWNKLNRVSAAQTGTVTLGSASATAQDVTVLSGTANFNATTATFRDVNVTGTAALGIAGVTNVASLTATGSSAVINVTAPENLHFAGTSGTPSLTGTVNVSSTGPNAAHFQLAADVATSYDTFKAGTLVPGGIYLGNGGMLFLNANSKLTTSGLVDVNQAIFVSGTPLIDPTFNNTNATFRIESTAVQAPGTTFYFHNITLNAGAVFVLSANNIPALPTRVDFTLAANATGSDRGGDQHRSFDIGNVASSAPGTGRVFTLGETAAQFAATVQLTDGLYGNVSNDMTLNLVNAQLNVFPTATFNNASVILGPTGFTNSKIAFQPLTATTNFGGNFSVVSGTTASITLPTDTVAAVAQIASLTFGDATLAVNQGALSSLQVTGNTTVNGSGAASLTGSGAVDLGTLNTSQTFTLNRSGTTTTVLGSFTGTLVQAGSGGTTVSSITGGTLNGILTVNAGTLTITPDLNGGTVSFGGGTLALTAPVTHVTNFNVTGGSYTMGTNLAVSNATTVTGGTLVINSLSSFGTGGLAVNTGGTAQVQTGLTSPTAALVFTQLPLTGGKLDITNNRIVIRSASDISNTIRDAVIQTKLTTTTTTAPVSNLATTLGYLTGADYATLNGTSSFGGTTLATNDEAVRWTYAGDINLDGLVDLRDFKLMDLGYVSGYDGVAAVAAWKNGDVNHDGVVNAADFGLAVANINGTQLGNEMYTLYSSEFGSPFVQAFDAAVPEPASLMLLGLGAAGLLLRRRK